MKTVLLTTYFKTEPKDFETSPIIRSIGIPLGKKPPKERLICLAGNPLRFLSKVRKDAVKARKSLFRVEIIIDRGIMIPSHTTMETLPEVYYLSLERINAEMIAILYDLLAKPGEYFEYHNPNYVIGIHPDRLNLIWKDQRFEHLSAIAWSAPISMNPPQFMKLAALKSLDKIESYHPINYGGDEAKIRFEI